MSDHSLTKPNSRSYEANNTRGPLKISAFNMTLVALGAWIHVLAESSALPLAAALIYYCVGRVVLLVPSIGGVWERRMYARVFLVGFLIAGISGLFRTFSGDGIGDAANFFRLASQLADGWSLAKIASITEGAAAVVLWRGAFDFMALLGFPRLQYIGIFVNVLLVALSGVVALKMARLVYGEDVLRFRRLILLFSACGLFWLFSGTLYRDSVVLLGVSTLALAWLYFLKRPDLSFRFSLIVASSLVATAYFGFMRQEFVFVPTAMMMAALTALLIGNSTRDYRAITYLLIFVGLIVSGWFLVYKGEILQLYLSRGLDGYVEAAIKQHEAGSLGVSLIVSQPMIIRLPLAFIYLFVFPIPFWTGFQFESSYHLYKSFNVIYFYFVIPLLVLASCRLWTDKSFRSPAILFLFFVLIGFTMAIAGTSLETRHHGAFFAPLFLLALAPDFRVRAIRQQYMFLLAFLLSGVFLVHFAWITIKAV